MTITRYFICSIAVRSLQRGNFPSRRLLKRNPNEVGSSERLSSEPFNCIRLSARLRAPVGAVFPLQKHEVQETTNSQ